MYKAWNQKANTADLTIAMMKRFLVSELDAFNKIKEILESFEESEDTDPETRRTDEVEEDLQPEEEAQKACFLRSVQDCGHCDGSLDCSESTSSIPCEDCSGDDCYFKGRRVSALEAVDLERDYQSEIYGYGCDDVMSVSCWLNLIESYVNDAKDLALADSIEDSHEALHTVRKIAALAVACMEARGIYRRSNDKKA